MWNAETHRTKEKTLVAIGEMEDSHLYNTIKWRIRRVAEARQKLDDLTKDIDLKATLVLIANGRRPEYLTAIKELDTEIARDITALQFLVLEGLLRPSIQYPVANLWRQVIGRTEAEPSFQQRNAVEKYVSTNLPRKSNRCAFGRDWNDEDQLHGMSLGLDDWG